MYFLPELWAVVAAVAKIFSEKSNITKINSFYHFFYMLRIYENKSNKLKNKQTNSLYGSLWHIAYRSGDIAENKKTTQGKNENNFCLQRTSFFFIIAGIFLRFDILFNCHHLNSQCCKIASPVAAKASRGTHKKAQ